MKAFSRRRTKILCTVGPAVDDPEKLFDLANRGMNLVRLNFSHGTHESFSKTIGDIREIEKRVGRPIGILGDIQGPKIRVGKLPGGQVKIATGQMVTIASEGMANVNASRTVITTTYKDFVKDVGEGHRILLDDGLLELEVVSKGAKELKCTVVNGGILFENKGINVPAVSFSVHAITEKDYGDILFCLEKNLDFIALSFVRTEQEVRHVCDFVKARKKSTKVFAKIEMKQAVETLDAIIDASDGILVARGDLAVEVGNERVPVLQKKIVRMCNLRGKSVIIATQMLMSMVENPRPTRAEASDIANAILDGADVLMLSNETAVGKYPGESVSMMDKIIREMESVDRDQDIQRVLYNEWNLSPEFERAMALMQSAVRLASILKARAMVIVTRSGSSALLISKCRPRTDVLAITADLATYRQLSMHWGSDAIHMEDMPSLISQTAMFEAIGQRLLALNLVRTGDTIIITAGLPNLEQGSTNTIKVHRI